MTRLTSNDIDTIGDQLPAYDRYLKAATGRSLLGIGAAAAGIADVPSLQHCAASVKMAVVPIKSGRGIIGGFTAAVCEILTHLGFHAWVTGKTDVSGLAEAVENDAQVILAADDDRFVALCLRQAEIVDNARATADGYVAGLDLMAGGLASKPVLVIGCGPVGRWAVRALIMRRARVCVYDRVDSRAADLVRWATIEHGAAVYVAPGLEEALGAHDLIVEATDAADIIHANHVGPHTRIAAPGMPCGITEAAMQQLVGRILHDPLQIGVAVMACDAVRLMDADPATGGRGDWC